MAVAGSISHTGSLDNEKLTVNWGDGSSNDTHTYAKPGTYTGTVAVTDWGGGSDSQTFTKTIQGAQTDPATQPTSVPTTQATAISSRQPTTVPSPQPTSVASPQATSVPTTQPASVPATSPVSSDLRLVAMNHTGTGTSEVHILTAASNYKQFSLETGTALEASTAGQWAFAFAPNADLYAIKLNSTASNHTEVHILSAASKYQQFSQHIVTPLATVDPHNVTFQVGSNGDLYTITAANSASGKVEVQTLTAASNFQQVSKPTATALAAVKPTEWEFHLTFANDLLGVHLSSTGSGKTEVHILSAATNYQQYRLEVPTVLGPTNRSAWQFRMGANDDLLAIFINGTASGSTEVHRLSASSNYGKFNLEVPTPLPMTGPGLWNLGVGSLDY